MKRKSGFILLTIFAGFLAVAGIVDKLEAVQAQRVQQVVSLEDDGFLSDASGNWQHYVANVGMPVSNVALSVFQSEIFNNNSADRNDFRSIHTPHSSISFKAGKLCDSNIQIRYVKEMCLLPFGFADPDKVFICLGRLII